MKKEIVAIIKNKKDKGLMKIIDVGQYNKIEINKLLLAYENNKYFDFEITTRNRFGE